MVRVRRCWRSGERWWGILETRLELREAEIAKLPANSGGENLTKSFGQSQRASQSLNRGHIAKLLHFSNKSRPASAMVARETSNLEAAGSSPALVRIIAPASVLSMVKVRFLRSPTFCTFCMHIALL